MKNWFTILVFLVAIAISTTISTNGQTKPQNIKPDIMTLELAEADFPKITIRTEANGLMLFMSYFDPVFDKIGFIADSACERMGCNAMEINVTFKSDSDIYNFALRDNPNIKISKSKKYRPVIIDVTLPRQPFRAEPKQKSDS